MSPRLVAFFFRHLQNARSDQMQLAHTSVRRQIHFFDLQRHV